MRSTKKKITKMRRHPETKGQPHRNEKGTKQQY